MATSLVVNGVSYLYPDTGDQSWGTVASAWAAAVTTGMLQKTGGAFTLTADVNFGGTFGLLSKYFTSITANPAGSGAIRLASSDVLSFRNNGNSADIALGKNASDQLTWAGVAIISAAGVTLVSAGGTGLTSGTSGGILGFTGTGTIASSALLTANQLIVGGGAGATPATLAAGSQYQSLVMGASTPGYGAVNLAQSAAVTGILSVSNGGTGLNSLTSAGVLVGNGASNPTFVAPGLSGNVLTSNGSTWTSATPTNSGTVTSVTFTGDGTVLSSTPSSAVTVSGTLTAALKTQTKNTFLAGPTSGSAASPTFRVLNPADFTAPSVSRFLSTGATAGYIFTISTTTTCAVGDTYTNNGHTYTVISALSAATGQVLFMSGASAPTAPGTPLVVSVGSGTTSISFTASTPLAAYTLPSGPAPLYLKARVSGAGSGGTGGGINRTASSAGLSTLFASSTFTVTAAGGAAATPGGIPPAGATVTITGSGVSLYTQAGGIGTGGSNSTSITSSTVKLAGGTGGQNLLGGAGGGGDATGSNNGGAGAANTGAGGGGGYAISAAGPAAAGPGGNAGAYGDGLITGTLPAVIYYAIGAGGAHASDSQSNGGDGGSGFLEFTEHYQ